MITGVFYCFLSDQLLECSKVDLLRLAKISCGYVCGYVKYMS